MPTYRYAALMAPMGLTLGIMGAIALPAWGQNQGIHYVNGVQGDVVVGQFLVTPDPASEGMLLPTTHKIRLGRNSRVTLNCSNGGRYNFDNADTYAVADYCPSAASRRPGSANNPSRAPFDASLPYILSPRNTVLLGPEPLTLQWNPIEGATSYTVVIQGSGVNWTTQVNEPQATYDAVDQLKLDYRYTIVVETDNGLSSAKGPEVGFAVFSQAERARVNAQVAEVKARQLEPDVEAIALSLVYLEFEHSDPDRQSYALNQSALDVLEARIQAGSENSQVYLLQAETYQVVELPLQAQERYEQALALAQTTGQRELQAQSHLGLATVAEGQTEYRDAIAHLQATQQLYRELGDLEQVEELQTRIERLSREFSPS